MTTNPTLVAKYGGKVAPLVAEIARHTQGPISAEGNRLTLPEMLDEARALAVLHPRW